MAIYKIKGSPYWQYDFTVGGNRFRGSTETDNKQQAKAIYAKLRSNAVIGTHYTLPGQMTLTQAFAKYWLEHAQFLKWAPSIKAHVQHIMKHLGENTGLHKIGIGELQGYVAACRSETYKRMVPSKEGMRAGSQKLKLGTSTINRRIAVFRGMHNKARLSWNVQVQNINFEEVSLSEPDVVDNSLTSEEAIRVFDASPTHLQHFIMLSLYTGFRKANVLSIEGQHIDIARRQITVYGKSNKPGGKKITQPILDPLYDYILKKKLHKIEGKVITHNGNPVKDIRTAFNTAIRDAEIPHKVRPHDLRHTFCTWLYEGTKDPILVKMMARHASLETTQRYIHVVDETMKDRANKALTPKLRQTRRVK